jgi:hypothetical protein
MKVGSYFPVEYQLLKEEFALLLQCCWFLCHALRMVDVL